MTEQEKTTAEEALYDELGFLFKRQNSSLTVISFGPPTKVESLVPGARGYTAHFLMDKAWDKLVELRAKVQALQQERESDALQAKIEWGNAISRAETAELSLSQAQEALRKYAHHLDGCGGFGADSLAGSNWEYSKKKWRDCTCGLAALLEKEP